MPCNRVSACVSVSLASCLSHPFNISRSRFFFFLFHVCCHCSHLALFLFNLVIAGVLRECVNQKRFSLSFFLFSFTHLVGVVFFFLRIIFEFRILLLACSVYRLLRSRSSSTHITRVHARNQCFKKKRSKYKSTHVREPNDYLSPDLASC